MIQGIGSGDVLRLVALLVSLVAPVDTPTGHVSLCAILAHPELYDQKSVLTSGVMRSGQEISDFVDPGCPPSSPENDVGTLPVPSTGRVQTSAAWKRLGKILERDRQAFVVVRATFDAFNRYEGPLPDDPRMQEILHLGNRRFGHLLFARFRLRIESVEYVVPVNK